MSDTSNKNDSLDDIDKDNQKNSESKMGTVKSKLKKLIKTEKTESEEMEIATSDYPFMCGVVEGFYGRPWTAEQRKELFRRLEEMGLNTYLYAPKDDCKHRLFWREKYSIDETELLKTLIDEAASHNVTFVYAISPGLDMTFASQKEITALKEKLLQVKELGCKAFALLFDDIDPVLCASDMEEFQSSADAQASVTNMMYTALDKPRFIFCPTEYCNSMAIPDVPTSPYLKTLGIKLHPQISVMWTGAKVVSNVITVDSIKLLNKILKRKVMIWDNIHANDYDPKRVFLGPYKGRSTCLIPHISGVLTNPNCEFESNFIAMHTIATWWKCHKAKKSSDKDDKEDKSREETSVQKSSKMSSKSPITDNDSISSGRASDTDTDTDSDYSSHEGGYFPSLSDFEHGDYNPDEALEMALQAWLPVFSWVRYPIKKIVPRSGTPPVLPQISNLPLTTRPPPPICVTTAVKEPMLAVREVAGFSENKSVTSKNPLQERSNSVKITVADDDAVSSKSDVEIEISEESQKLHSEVSTCAIPPLSNEEPFLKDSSSDVDMANSPKDPDADLDANEEIHSLNQDESDGKKGKNETKKLETAEMGDSKSVSSVDVEMKEELQPGLTEEKSVEEMQTSPKNSAHVDQMETEDVQEPSTPMMTDELDSDVSMATAQSGSVVQTDIDDMAAQSPVSNMAEMKDQERNKSLSSETVTKLGDVKEPAKPELATPKVAAMKTSMLQKYESHPMTTADLRLLAECFFLPYEHGQIGKSMVQKFKWLRENAIKLSRMKDHKSEAYLDKALDWSERALAFEEHCRDLQNVFNKLCLCPNRALLYDIFPYLWDMKGVITMLRSYVKWLGRIEVKPASHEDVSGYSKDEPTKLAKSASSAGFGWIGPDPEPWVFRGGLSGEFQRLLPVSSAFDLFCQTLPLDPEVCTFIVRPYVPADEQSVFNVCFATNNDGIQSSDAFLSYKQLPADRLVGGFLALSPEYCFVVEDEDGICGYLVATIDAKKFWKKFEIAYLPEMREKYEKPAEKDDSPMNEAEKMIVDLHSTEDRFDYGSDELSNTHPSFLTMALHPKANSNIAKSMLVCLLSALKSHCSCGIHTVVPADSMYFLDLYTKLGFTTFQMNDRDSSEKPLKILGRTF